MEHVLTTHTLDNSMGKVSLKNGYWFYFSIGAHTIAAHGSGWSGNEAIYVDDELVCQKRNLGTSSTHDIVVDGESYQICFRVTSLIKGEVEVSLVKDGQTLSTETKAYIAGGFKEVVKQLLIYFGLGALTGVVIMTLFIKFFE